MGVTKSLLIAPVLLVVGTLLVSVGIGLFDFRIGMVVGGVLLSGISLLVASIVTRLEDRKHGDSGSVPASGSK